MNKVRTINDISNNDKTSDETLERKIVMATEGVRTKFIELTLRDRKRLSAENALTVSEYMILMKREINPRLTYVRYTAHFKKDCCFSLLHRNRIGELVEIAAGFNLFLNLCDCCNAIECWLSKVIVSYYCQDLFAS